MLSLDAPPDSEHISDALAMAVVGAARHGVEVWSQDERKKG